ncbi:glycosyltransferase family 4 protein [Halohasta salina]|uniref:glycosyltransferase family 4 protein n=1 Tax=Halohasta salina TaxID=2961621 RepID=UPI0021120895|nr:glycosyltransferase family 4 protein [Halohasta salina]
MFPPVVGGSAMYAYEIANALGARGHDVDIYTQSKPGEELTRSVHENVSVYTLTTARRYLVTFETLYYSLRARLGVNFDDYDVIHGTLMPASTIALTDRFTVDTPVVLTSHSFALSEVFAHSAEKPADYLLKYAFHPMNVVMDNICARGADRIIAISEEMREQLINRYYLDESKITRISHGVDTNRYRPHEKRHEAVSADALTLLFVGRLVSRKRADLAIEALAAADRSDIELLVAGTGRLEADLKKLAREHGVSDQVTFLGYVSEEDLPLLYSSVDATLFTSDYEGFGLVFMESLASGTPVIGTPVGGIPDVIEDGANGYVCPHDSSALAGRILELADDPKRLAAMSTAAKNAVRTRNWEDVAKRVEAVYEDVI